MPYAFDEVAKRYDLLNDLISLGLHRRWKQNLVCELSSESPQARVILDVGTGTGDLPRLFQRMRYASDSRILGVDPSDGMLEVARRKSQGIEWLRGTSESLPLPDSSIDILSCSFGVRNLANRPQAFQEWSRVMKRGAIGGILEIHPSGSGASQIPARFYWKYGVPLVGRIFGRAEAYRYLSSSARSFVSLQELAGELCAAGFRVRGARSVFGSGMVGSVIFERA